MAKGISNTREREREKEANYLPDESKETRIEKKVCMERKKETRRLRVPTADATDGILEILNTQQKKKLSKIKCADFYPNEPTSGVDESIKYKWIKR